MPADAATQATPQAAMQAPDPAAGVANTPIQVPPEVLQQLAGSPLVQALQKNEPGAAYFKAGAVGGSDKLHEQYMKMSAAMPQLGLAAYKSDKHDVLVIFNPQAHSEAEIAAADAAGKLGRIAIPATGSKHGHMPTDEEGGMPVDPDTANPGAIAGGLIGGNPTSAPLPPEVQAQIAKGRVANLAAQPPVDQASPASGAIINGLMKRSV